MDPKSIRRQFAIGMLTGLQVVWPVLSVLLLAVTALGVVIGRFEGWSASESIYFAFVSALTIGYGDLSPKTGPGRLLAVVIGICGLMLTALLAAIAVKALTAARERRGEDL